MNLSKKNIASVSALLFSMFFGAGNLIFPPFLGQNAGNLSVPAAIGFCITAVLLPVLGIIVISKADGLERLASKVDPRFAAAFTFLIYISLGPGLAIPRAASVPFEMAVVPYLPEQVSVGASMFVYSFLFFAVSLWLSLNTNRLMSMVGNVLTPLLLFLIVFLFGAFLVKGEVSIADAQAAYMDNAFIKGFYEGYQTMDAIAALNFGLVVATTLKALGVKDKKAIVGYTTQTGLLAGGMLAAVYAMLTYMGMASSGVYPIQENGAWTLRSIVYQLFGDVGAVLLAAIFMLACITTCVGLITSVAEYLASLTKRLSYKQFVYIIAVFSFMICNQGLNVILQISIPILNAIYPAAIVLILLGLLDKYIAHNPYIYPFTVLGTVVVSIIFVLDEQGVSMGILSSICHKMPFYSLGFGWITVSVVMIVLSYIIKSIKTSRRKK